MAFIFDSYESSTTRYDEMFDRAGSLMNETAFIYAAFIAEILKKISGDISLDAIEIPYYGSSGYCIASTDKLYLDSDTDSPYLSFSDGHDAVPFSDLNVVAQDIISQYIFIEIKTIDMQRSLFSGTDQDKKI